MLVRLSTYNINQPKIAKKSFSDNNLMKNYQTNLYSNNYQISFKANPKIYLFEDVAKIIKNGDIDAIKRIPDLHVLSSELKSLLHISAEEKQVEISKHLLNVGLSVNQKDKMGRTPFAISCINQDEPSIHLFSKFNPDVNTQDELGDTPLHHVRNNHNLLGFLLDRRANPYIKNEFGLPVLHAVSDNLETLEFLLKRGVSPDSINSEEQTLLHTASLEGNQRLAELLIKYNAEKNYRDKFGRTPLFYAKDYKMLRWLLECGVKNDIQDRNGRTALYEFTVRNDPRSVIALLRSKANPNILDKDGKAPILLARNNIIRKILLEGGADPNVRTNGGQTLLHKASKMNNEEVITTLLTYHADPNLLDDEGRSPLSLAPNNRIRKLLLEYGANLNEKPYLHWALKTNNYEFFNDLLNAEIDVNMEDKLGRTPIFYCRNSDDIRKLAGKGAFIDYQDNNGNTPLHLYSAAGKTDIVQTLRELGANEQTTNINGDTPDNLSEQFRIYGCWIK